MVEFWAEQVVVERLVVDIVDSQSEWVVGLVAVAESDSDSSDKELIGLELAPKWAVWPPFLNFFKFIFQNPSNNTI